MTLDFKDLELIYGKEKALLEYKSLLVGEVDEAVINLYKYGVLGIEISCVDTNFKLLEYTRKASWAVNKKRQQEASEENIDYSEYHLQALLYHPLCVARGIIKDTEDEAFVELILYYNKLGEVALSKITSNSYLLKKKILEAESKSDVDLLLPNFENDLKEGISKI